MLVDYQPIESITSITVDVTCHNSEPPFECEFDPSRLDFTVPEGVALECRVEHSLEQRTFKGIATRTKTGLIRLKELR